MAYKDINEKRAKAREYYYKNKDRISARNKSNYQKPEVKAKKKAYIDVYRKTPQAMAKRRAWRQKNILLINVESENEAVLIDKISGQMRKKLRLALD